MKYTRTKKACHYTYLAMSSVFSLPPILFVTFRNMYGISYTLLGTLVLINFCTQLTVDLLFTFFAKRFHIHNTIKVMPLLTCVGLLLYALIPTFFPQYAYAGMAIGTVVFSVAAGLCEVLLSPLVAALPSDNPEREMSLLHSLYAYGVVSVVVISSVFLKIFGTDNWMYLTLFWAALPLVSSFLFFTSPLPDMNLSPEASPRTAKHKTTGLFFCTACIFLGGATESAMTTWVSGYMETALHIPKTAGDILGLAGFAVLLGLGRTWYAKWGKNIARFLLLGMVGSVFCYVIASLSSINAVSLTACILTGLCTSMLWPGTLIFMEQKLPHIGVAAYALMAAGGDLGCSVSPQLLGVVVDTVAATPWAARLGETLSLSAEQVGLKVGMLTASLFPLLGIVLILIMISYFKKASSSQEAPYV